MQTSKNHFEAKVVFNDETIRRMFLKAESAYEWHCPEYHDRHTEEQRQQRFPSFYHQILHEIIF